MTDVTDPKLDLIISRIIRAPRPRVWRAWTDPAQLVQWWIPAPMHLRIDAFEPRPGGAFTTSMSEDGTNFVPHVDGCFLDLADAERLVFTTALRAGWRPAAAPFINMTAIVTFADHEGGTELSARVLHKDAEDSTRHREMGFSDGWGTTLAQLAAVVEA